MFLSKIKQHVTPKRLFSGLILLALITANAAGILHAQSVTQGYGTDETLQKGMIVGLEEGDPTKVRSINLDQIDSILGVVVDPNASPITLSDEEERAFVATIGRYDVFVSTQNGTIHPNDYVTVSSLNGIGMLATFEESEILGRAISGFDGSGTVIGEATLTDTAGNTRNVKIGRIQVDIGIANNPLAKSAAVTPEWLGRVGQAIAGKSLSPARIYISTAIFLIGSFIAGAILYAGIRSSIIAIGRNPLSKKSILRGLVQVIFTSLIVFIISVGGVYLLLRV